MQVVNSVAYTPLYKGMSHLPTLLEAHNVRVVGNGKEIVVLGHGFGTDQSVWKHVLPHLVDDYKVILFDNMGAGTTDPEYFSFKRYSNLYGYADDLLTILSGLLHLQWTLGVGYGWMLSLDRTASHLLQDYYDLCYSKVCPCVVITYFLTLYTSHGLSI